MTISLDYATISGSVAVLAACRPNTACDGKYCSQVDWVNTRESYSKRRRFKAKQLQEKSQQLRALCSTTCCISCSASWTLRPQQTHGKATSDAKFPKQLPPPVQWTICEIFVRGFFLFFGGRRNKTLALYASRLQQRDKVAGICSSTSAGSRAPSDGSDLLL